MKKNLMAALTVASLALPLLVLAAEPSSLPIALSNSPLSESRPATATERAHLQRLIDQRIKARNALSATTPGIASLQPAEPQSYLSCFFAYIFGASQEKKIPTPEQKDWLGKLEQERKDQSNSRLTMDEYKAQLRREFPLDESQAADYSSEDEYWTALFVRQKASAALPASTLEALRQQSAPTLVIDAPQTVLAREKKALTPQ